MLDQLDDKTDDLELETPEPEVDGADPDGLEPDGNADQAEADGEGEVIVSFGDEEPEQPQEAAEWVTALRKQNRELKAKVKELEVVAQPKRDVQMPKPTLEACDYDADKFETELLAWNAQKAEAGRAEAEAKQAWENRLKTYSEQKQALRVRGFDDAEDAVREIMSVTQQGIILQAADEPARLVYALGLSPSKAKELAGEKDPVRFAAKVAKMEMQLKDTPRKPAAAPDRKPVGAGATPAALQPRLDKLKAEAHASGDWTKYFAEKRNSQG